MIGGLSLELIGSSLVQLLIALAIIVGGFVIIDGGVLGLSKIFRFRNRLYLALLVPALVGLGLLIVYPILFEFRLAFSDMSLRTFRNPTFGFAQFGRNITRLFTEPVLQQQHFFPLLWRTIFWTVSQVTIHVGLGLFLALLMNTDIKMKWLYKALLILPWAIPDVISGLAWRSEFHFEFGFINNMLQALSLAPVQWKASPIWNWVAINITNIWLGIPFMMVVCLGGLQSISKEYYEAANMDGASVLQRFRHITLPLMRPVLTPAIVLGIIWTFNNFNVPFFINEFELESSDILVTALFRAAFQYNQYGFAAAFALVIFVILLAISLTYLKLSGGLKAVND